jgi:hypothetical protein
MSHKDTESPASALPAKAAAKLDAIPFYHEIREALGQPGCPLCRLLTRDADRQLDAVLWELVNDPDARTELNQARGYCQQHGWMLVRAGAAVGVAILMRDVVRTLLETVASNPVASAPGSVLGDLVRGRNKDPRARRTAKLVAALSPQIPCPVCARLEPRERDYLRTLLAHLEAPGALADVYHNSDGLCLAHFRQALAHTRSTGEAETLIAAQKAVWQKLHAELDEFVRKSDWRFRDESYGAEKDAWRRALAAVSGPPPHSRSERQGLTGSS